MAGVIIVALLVLLAVGAVMAQRRNRRAIDSMPGTIGHGTARTPGVIRPLAGRPQPVSVWQEPERGVVIARRPAGVRSSMTVRAARR